MQPTSHEASFLSECLRCLALQAPCRPRIEAVADRIEAGGPLPGAIFARVVAMSGVLWGIDSGLVGEAQRDTAQRVLDKVWAAGPVRPAVIARQLQCLVGQPPSEAHCLWTCPTMVRANAGYEGTGQSGPQLGGPHRGLTGTVFTESAEILRMARLHQGSRLSAPARLPGHGSRVTCAGCGDEGTILGVDPEDGWTVVEHHPPVQQRMDGIWEVAPHVGDPRQCGYLQASA